MSAFINSDTSFQEAQQQQHSSKLPPQRTTAAGTIAVQEQSRPVDFFMPGDESEINDIDGKLSPVSASSPRAASPFAASCPVDVPASNGNSSNGSAARTLQQGPSDAAEGVITTARSLHGPMGVPPLSPPDPDLNPQVLEQLLQKASPALTDNRFSMADFLKNKAAMTAAARRELAGGADHTLLGPAVEADDVANSLQGG